MWQSLAKFVLKFRLVLLIILLAVTGGMAYLTSKVKVSYEFARAIPTDNPKYQQYLSFQKKFGAISFCLIFALPLKKGCLNW